MYDQYIAEIDRAATTFLLQIVWVCLLSLLHSEQQQKAIQDKVMHYSPSGLFKVIQIGANGKRLCDFLLVFHCNYMPFFCHLTT